MIATMATTRLQIDIDQGLAEALATEARANDCSLDSLVASVLMEHVTGDVSEEEINRILGWSEEREARLRKAIAEAPGRPLVYPSTKGLVDGVSRHPTADELQELTSPEWHEH